jgi:hypothetical protein
MIVYVRDRGPICYEALVFNKEVTLAALPGQLLSSGLGWCWESLRTGEPSQDSASLGLPPERPMIALTAENAGSLFDDLCEENVDGNGRKIGLFGVDAAAVPTLLDPVGFRGALEAYLVHERGPIRMVVVLIEDTDPQCFFVPHEPCSEVSVLLRMWKMHGPARKTRPYGRLRLAALESIYEGYRPLINRT